jgi:Domain of unknown function
LLFLECGPCFNTTLVFFQNPEYVIYRTLGHIGCPQGIERMDHMKGKNNMQKDDKNEKKEVESYESMAKSMSTASVLIASATFAAAFTVCGVYINKKELYDTPHLDLALKVFFIMDAYAFFCSVIATGLLVEAALNFLDPAYRKRYLIQCTALVMMAAKGLIVAFGTGAYVILTPVSNWLAILVYVASAIGPAVFQPHHWPSLLVIKTIMEYREQKEPLGKQQDVSAKISAKPRTLRDSISLFESRFYLDILYYWMIVLSVMIDSLMPWTSRRTWILNFCSLFYKYLTLAAIVLFLVLSCFNPVYSTMMEKHLKPSKKVQCVV